MTDFNFDALGQFLHEESQRDSGEQDQRTATRLLNSLFPEQRDLVIDPSLRKAAHCPRRAGKSYCCLVYAFIVCHRIPYAKVSIVSRVRQQGYRIYWTDAKQIARMHDFRCTFFKQELSIEFSNGSVLQFRGADTAEEIDKFRGQSHDLVIVDECKSYSPALLTEFVKEVIDAGLKDRRGTLVLIGTPGAVAAGPFCAVTTGKLDSLPERGRGWWKSRAWKDRDKEPEVSWSRHHWTLEANTKKYIWDEVLKDKELSEIPDDDPVFRREYLAEWIPDEDSLVYHYYRFDDGRCDWIPDWENLHGLPSGHAWRFVLGIDLGYTQPSAFVVGAWSETYEALILCYSEKQPELVVEDVCEKIDELQAAYGDFDQIIVDSGGGGSKMVSESMKRTWGHNITPAKKSEKNEHIALFNSDLTRGRLKLNPAGLIAEEMRTTQWEDRGKTKIDRMCDDHCCDAALYLWRYVYHHHSRSAERKLEPNSDEWWKRYEAELEERTREAYQETAWMDKYRDLRAEGLQRGRDLRWRRSMRSFS